MELHHTISGSGETIIFLHGAFINSEIWQYQQAHFKSNYQVITVDLRGHGKSIGCDCEEYSVAMFGEDIIQMMNNLGVEKATICGLSLGAMVAQYLGANHPSRVQGLILVGATASLRLSLLERFVTTFIFPKWFAMWLFQRLTIQEFMKLSFFMTWFMLGNKWLGGSSTREKIRKSISNTKQGELKKIYAAVHSFRKQNLKSGVYPVLILNGQFDSPVIHWHGTYLKRKVGSRASQIRLEGSGHACNYDQPLVFNQLMQTWLSKNGFLPTKTSFAMVQELAPALQHAS